MKLSDLLQVPPRITLALVEETAEMFNENGKRRGRDASKYAASLTYAYDAGLYIGLGLTVECVATIDRDGVATIVDIDIADSGREVWALGVDELSELDKATTHWMGALEQEVSADTMALVKKLMADTPFKSTKTFILEWI